MGFVWQHLDLTEFQEDQENLNYTLEQAWDLLDIDKNGYLNTFEATRIVWGPENPRGAQVNCSSCAPDVLTYYLPWDWDEIQYWTNYTLYKLTNYLAEKKKNGW